MTLSIRACLTVIVCLSGITAQTALAAGKPLFSSAELSVQLVVRTPEQIAAFYEARGFEKAMIDILKQQCFIGVRIKNTSRNIIWLDLANWHFSDQQGTIQRLDRHYWKAKWTEMKIPMAHQSTFRWTLLPEKLDFRPDEAEGGNILLPRRGHPVTIKAGFNMEVAGTQQTIPVQFNNIECTK